jgi:hypothetical protein
MTRQDDSVKPSTLVALGASLMAPFSPTDARQINSLGLREKRPTLTRRGKWINARSGPIRHALASRLPIETG